MDDVLALCTAEQFALWSLRRRRACPWDAATLAGSDSKRQPSANELEIARFQGRHVAEIAKALKAGRTQ